MRRISKLESELKDLTATRDLQRKSRSRSGLAAVTIVGYTNAGKSTLLNYLTHAGCWSRTGCSPRSIRRPDDCRCRVASRCSSPTRSASSATFRTDWSRRSRARSRSPAAATTWCTWSIAPRADPEGQISAVRDVLLEIGASHLPELLVFNKCDAEPDVAKNLVDRYEGSVAVSALTGEGIEGFPLRLGRPVAGAQQGRRVADSVRPRRPARRGPSRRRGAVDAPRRGWSTSAGTPRRCVRRASVRVRRRDGLNHHW